MIQKIADFFWRVAGRNTFIAALLVYLVFGLYIMPTGLAKIQELSGKKVEVLDLQFTYTPEKARAIAASYGDAGRDFAARFEMLGDGLYPLVYTFLFLIILAWVFKSLAPYGIRVRYIHLLPLLVMFADYGENTCIISILKNYPNISDQLAMASSFFTSLKWSLLIVVTLVIGVSLWMLTFYRMTRGKAVSK